MMKTFTWSACVFWGLSACFAHGQENARVAPPDGLRASIREAERRASPLSIRTTVESVYAWAAANIAQVGATQSLTALGELVPRFEYGLARSLRERAAIRQRENRLVIAFDAEMWKSEAREVAVLSLAYCSTPAGRDVSLVSSPPRIYARIAGHIAEYDMANSQFGSLGSISYGLHGFVNDPRGSGFPEVIVSVGPVGSGNFVYVVQLHFEEQGQAWKVQDYRHWAHAQDVTLTDDLVSISYFASANDIRVASYRVAWGQRMVNIP